MKNILLLLFFPLFLTAQTGSPVLDTSYFEKQGGTFFEIKKQVFQDGSEQTWKTVIGDSAAFVTAAKNRLVSQSTTMAVDVRHVSTYSRRMKELLREADQVRTLTGTDPQRLIQDEMQSVFLAGTWSIKRDGTTSDVVFTINGQGALRFSVAGAATKAALVIGDAIRLKNYPANGGDTDVFRLPNGVWVNVDRSVVLRPPGNNDPVNRAAQPATTKKG